jgi:uncharacterized protein (TIGR00661 family)
LKKSKRILFLINGLGLGNSTRCEALIQKLIKKGFAITVATSGNGYDYFKNNDLNLELVELSQQLYGKSKKGDLSIFNTFFLLPQMLVTFLINLKILFPLIRSSQFQAAIFDSEYSILFLKPFIHFPLIGLNNATVITHFFKNKRKLPPNLYGQFVIEKLDSFYYGLTADHIICPRLSNIEETIDKITYCPPLIRPQLKNRVGSKTVKKGLVMLSGSQFKSDLSFLMDGRFKNIEWELIGQDQKIEGVLSSGKVYNNENKFDNADFLIINAGFSAISEAAVLGIPALVLPIKNHAEQYVNATSFEELKLGVNSDNRPKDECLERLLDNYESFKTRPLLNNGVNFAVTQIEHVMDNYYE